MFSVLAERDVTEAELTEFLHHLFPDMEFDVCSSLPETEKRGVIVTVDSFTNSYKTKIEFWLHDKVNGIEFTQYVGENLSLAFECDTVIEVKAEGHPFDQYNSLLIRGKQKYVIDDDGIEFDNYKPKIKFEWTKEIKQFDSKGCLQHQL
jgi:hypothetical protein